MTDYTNPFGHDYYAYHIGGRTGELPGPEDGDDVRELRSLLDRLAVGDRVVWSGEHAARTEPLHVNSIRRNGDGTHEWLLHGPEGGRYSITTDPTPTERPRVWYYTPSGERQTPNEGGGLRSLILVAGSTE